ncbi:MAG: hypothetical protein ACRD6X_19840 [Pyrinomonadaceae bacterium]
MKRIKYIIAISSFSMLVLALPAVASAQWGPNNGGYYPNGNNRNGGYYGGDLERVGDRLKDNSKDFEKLVDREFRNNRNGNRNRNVGIFGTIFGNDPYGNRGYGGQNIMRLADDFKRAASDFENRTDDNDRNRNGRNQQSAQRLLQIGSQIDRELRYARVSSNLQYKWQAIRSDLSIVANAYGNNNRRGNRNGRNPF